MQLPIEWLNEGKLMHVYDLSNSGKLYVTNNSPEVICMANGHDLIKYMTVEIVNYIDTPKDERKQAKASAKATREHWLTRWFGWGPTSVLLWWRGRTER
jgi:hypothetical protein